MRNLSVVPAPDMSWLQPGVMVVVESITRGVTLRSATLEDKDPYLFVSKFYPDSAVYIMCVDDPDLPSSQFTPEVQKLLADCPVKVSKIVYMRDSILL